ncbi:MAG: M56 family metallopeptidase [Planctomycetota bacterium]|jgi:beta-lactamase regulating signal transducer with metallopeptidase domain
MEAFNTQLLRFFDWLLWASMQGTVLIIMIIVIQKILRRRLPVHWHYLLWLLLLIRLAVPWLPESRMSIFNLVPRSVQQGRIIESFSQSRSADPMGFYMHARSADVPQTTEESEPFSVSFVRMLPALWLVGTLLLAGYVLMRSISLWRTVKRERPITDSEILDLLEDCKMQMGVETILAVVVSDKIKSPALFGFIRPRLLLPQGILETYSLEELRYVFIHELGHLKQRDIYLGWLMALLQVVHWFNPLMWFAFGRMRADRELACDRLAISTMGPDEPPEYGRTIVNLLESFSQVSYLPSVAGILEDTCQIERRIKMIADYKKTPRPRWAGAVLLLTALACVVLTNAYVAKADFTFSEPTNLGPAINNAGWNGAICISPDGLELYFGSEDGNIWVARRATVNSEWEPALNLDPIVNSSAGDGGPCISLDGLSLYFVSDRPGGFGQLDIWMTTRVTVDDDWSFPENLGASINSAFWDWGQSLSADELQLYFTSNRPGGLGSHDMYVANRAGKDEPWGEPINLGSTINSSAREEFPHISEDGLLLFFSSKRSGGYGNYDLWVSRRQTINDPWDPPVNLGPMVNSTAGESAPVISPEGSMLYFHSNRPGGFGSYDAWQVSILPIVDFNADGSINTDDLLILIGYWGQNEPLCDIGPLPYGDDIVDIKDLEVFMSYWEKENMPEAPEEEQ